MIDNGAASPANDGNTEKEAGIGASGIGASGIGASTIGASSVVGSAIGASSVGASGVGEPSVGASSVSEPVNDETGLGWNDDPAVFKTGFAWKTATTKAYEAAARYVPLHRGDPERYR